MPTFYEQLNLPTTASTDEITAAIDRLYNQWRQLAVHPEYGTQAQQQLQLLENIRATLTDPEKRATYDDMIGLKEKIGGLIDPFSVLTANHNQQNTYSTPPSTCFSEKVYCKVCNKPNNIRTKFCVQCGSDLQTTSPQKTYNPTDQEIWTCIKCKTKNPLKTNICRNCDYIITRHCEVCQKETPIRIENCVFCHTNHDTSHMINHHKKAMSVQVLRISLARSDKLMMFYVSRTNIDILSIYISIIIFTFITKTADIVYITISILIFVRLNVNLRRFHMTSRINVLVSLTMTLPILLFALLINIFVNQYIFEKPIDITVILIIIAVIYLSYNKYQNFKHFKSKYFHLEQSCNENFSIYEKHRDSISLLKNNH